MRLPGQSVRYHPFTGVMNVQSPLRLGKESDDLPHQPLPLVGREEILGVGRALENHQLLGTRRPLVLIANDRESKRATARRVAAGGDEERAALHPLGLIDGRRRQQHDPIDLTLPRLDGRPRCGSPTETRPDNGDKTTPTRLEARDQSASLTSAGSHCRRPWRTVNTTSRLASIR